MQNEEFDWPFLARYLAGECDPGETEAFERWLASHPARRREFEAIRLAWERAASHEHAERADAALGRVMARAGIAAPRSGARRASATVGRFSGILRLAAVLAVAVVPAFYWLSHRERGGDEVVTTAEAPAETFETTRAQRATLRLPDGTRIVLAPESRLDVAGDFGRRGRVVWLRGEAYFEVARDPERPFVVRTEGAATEVLGTSFVVRTGREEGGTEVVVVDGRVGLRPAGADASPALPLGRGEAGRVDATGRLEIVDRVDVRASIAWMDGRLVFHRRPFAGVVAELERWYDVTIEYPTDALSHVTVTATFDNEPLDRVLDALDQLLDVVHTRDGRAIHFDLRS